MSTIEVKEKASTFVHKLFQYRMYIGKLEGWLRIHKEFADKTDDVLSTLNELKTGTGNKEIISLLTGFEHLIKPTQPLDDAQTEKIHTELRRGRDKYMKLIDTIQATYLHRLDELTEEVLRAKHGP